MSGDTPSTACPINLSSENFAPALKPVKLLSTKIRSRKAAAIATNPESPNTVATQLSKYTSDVSCLDVTQMESALDFWKTKQSTYEKLVPIAEDLLVAPASQAFAERIFSVSGMLTAGRRNRMKNLLK